MPLPRSSASNTVSAWSSRVWPTRIAAASLFVGDPRERVVAGVARAALDVGAPVDIDLTTRATAPTSRRGLGHDARVVGGPACNP